MRTIHEVMNNEISAAILAQITMSGGGITASKIAEKIDVPQSTVYDHLKVLERDGFIYPNEIKVKNFIKKVWYRSENQISTEEDLVFNKNLQERFIANGKNISSHIRFLNAFIRDKLVKMLAIDDEAFSEHQKSSKAPIYVKQLVINKDDYEFFLRQLLDLQRQLEERNVSSTEDRRHLLEDEKYLIFTLAICDLETIKSSK